MLIPVGYQYRIPPGRILEVQPKVCTALHGLLAWVADEGDESLSASFLTGI